MVITFLPLCLSFYLSTPPLSLSLSLSLSHTHTHTHTLFRVREILKGTLDHLAASKYTG